ncbi:hypothetical protein BATDEDRAFT_18633 [Batrachochytrium dendrobatidis JAM81]|uniref:P-loop containing nucleoside triphosphate hydrolase protein n=1 Tax=Batrachochytrium dendrobatidis (strain JAM81 / FGSC 10211) TaxID=684364 RepID=F4NTL2_BATDJ|nr:uncharacterized protein BATDEDRAFT_18633 [Batrachochytrium dendrobatidis JAM81]EGF83523.1 hypothetical protein BATDEDRAFT_18633 [Batrachochytrium dendrobatidis JAM81]|eukprot:XP_006675195.1 hypothetical protein BATDEDRAFT_18633 [Batrachochytrium dendrobatidis JAM81]
MLIIQSGAGLAFTLFALQIGSSIFRATSDQIIRRTEINIRTIIICAIYEKTLKLSGQSSIKFTQGKILNLINVDAEKIAQAIQGVAGVYATPIQIAVAIYLLGQLLGYSVWAGAGALFFALLIQGGMIGFFVKYQRLFLDFGDKRLKALREMLYGIKIIKFRALEEFFFDRITTIRNGQIKALKNYYIVQVFFVGIIQVIPVLMPIVAFIAFSLSNGSITAPIIFPALSLFNILFQPLLVLPGSLASVVLAKVSWDRIRDFILAEEAEPRVESTFENTPDAPKDAAIQLSNATTKEENALFHLRHITTSIKKGSLVAIVGPVGSGKSSFLSGIIGEMRCIDGSMNIFGTLAYCSQQAWILTETIQGNILFNNSLDKTRMDAVIEASCLTNDLQQFPAGKMTQIGEKGVNLSGGQKARVSLARAMYQDCDTYLLDDPISALDAHVGADVFKLSIKQMLKDKTVILVTHQLHFLPEVDHVIVMDNGTIAEQGKFKDLVAKDGVLANMMKHYKLDDDEDKPIESKLKKTAAVVEDTGADKNGDIIVEEDRNLGAVEGKTYWSYVVACGGYSYLVVVAITAILAQASHLLTDLWLSWWTSNMYPNLTADQYLRIYTGLGGIQVFFSLALNAAILVGGYRSAHYYHSAALKRLIAAPMSFFDSQPIGRILNRMSKDVESIDQAIWILLFLAIISTTGLISIVVLMAYVLPYMLLIVVPLIVLYFYIIKYYQNANRELKRLESVQRSPLYAHISESLAGIATVKAFRVEKRFVQRQRTLMDLSNTPSMLKLLGSVWVNMRIELLASIVVLTLVLIGSYSDIHSSQIGIALTYAIGLTGLINLLLMAFSQLDAEMNAVERLDVYGNALPQEAPRSYDTDPASDSWPTKGAITIKNLEIRYESRPDFAVIKNLSLNIRPGEKIGVVGRTGSGKSTLMTTLFRIIEPSLGNIELDGIDISKLGLKTLRSRLQIIPQEPVLFTGTIRANLDVESKFEDASIWDVLERIGIKEYVTGLPEKLEAPVSENGENLSVGQRQLISLGRAILMQPIVLVMDEATASVDAEADKLIQQSIKTHFAHATVLSIAHRLNTIVDFDRVLVLQDGEMVEFDSPHILLGRSESLFSQLADATGAANAQLLREIASKKAASSAQK